MTFSASQLFESEAVTLHEIIDGAKRLIFPPGCKITISRSSSPNYWKVSSGDLTRVVNAEALDRAIYRQPDMA